MKDWLVARMSEWEFWVTRIEGPQDHPTEYLCGFCDGPLSNHVVAFFASSRGSPGTVACAICSSCDALLGEHLVPTGELDDRIELLLAEPGRPQLQVGGRA